MKTSYREYGPDQAEDYGLMKYIDGKEVGHFQPEGMTDLVIKNMQSKAS